MTTTLTTMSAIARRQWIRWAAGAIALVAVIGTVIGQSSPPSTPLITLAPSPLYAQGARAKPTLTLALSVEFPTVGAQYLSGNSGSSDDNTYSPAVEYPGYFDPSSCYGYHTETSADNRYFERTGSATAANASDPRSCSGTGFSGNFMNWAGASAIDILRYGLTGGDRVIDTASLTVLQRAVLPNSSVSNNFWNGSNFPSKQVSGSIAAGALPSALRGSYTGTIYVASCLNRIHFGTQKTGNCALPGDNSNLGIGTSSNAMGPVTSSTTGGSTGCAAENGLCVLPAGIREVYYGAGTKWYHAPATGTVTCSNGVFGDPISGTVKTCSYGPQTTTWTPPSTYGTTAMSPDGFFYDRVSVCTSDSAGLLLDPRPDLCLRYPNGNFKPVGNLQKYSDRVRVAVFGYLNDSTGNPAQRYGGVLRAPMKYVGPTWYDASFNLVSGANPSQEWNSSTGVFIENPDNNTTVRSGPLFTGPYLSGATNYLNQFGRTGVLGQYKTYDPIGELYYESMRYLQGLPPTPQAVVGVSPSVNPGLQDGYPASTAWTDPHPAVSGMTNYACVRNNIVAIGDIHTWNDKSIPGNTTQGNNEGLLTTIGFPFPPGRPANLAGNEPNFWDWTHVIGGFETNNSVGYTDGSGGSRTTGSPTNPNPTSGLYNLETFNIGAEGASYLMAGVAYWANTHDIRGAQWTTNWNSTVDPRRPGMRVSTYVIDVNENGESSNYNNRHKNQFFLTSKYGGFTDTSGTGSPFKTLDGSNNNSNWQDPANPLEANNYFLSSSAASVLNALNTIFSRIASQADSIAGGAVSTQRLTADNGFVYQGQFDAASWSGDLWSNALVVGSDNSVTVASTPTWKAATQLSLQDPSTRKIVIGKTTPTSAATATLFTWAGVDADVQAALQTPPYVASGTPDTTSAGIALGTARLNYLRGDRSNEAPLGQNLRTRKSPLGDIVNSAVAFMGAPSTQISDSTYTAFAATNASRKKTLFVGANDGMLHAFDSATGNELFGYIPSWMIPTLGNLTSNAYVHKSYVDGSAVVAEAKMGTTNTWKTVLVGATGGGGQGVFALDVSNPDNFGVDKVMWEFSDRDDRELGNVIGKPQILKLRTNALSATPEYKYFAVVASGVNNYANDGVGRFSTTGNPVLFFLDLSKAAGTAWQSSGAGQNYYKVTFPALTSMASGMTGFSATTDEADAVAALFAGDLQGNLWKLDFAQAVAGISDWTLAKLSSFKNSSSDPIPMFVAKTALGVRQPITMEPTLVYSTNRTIIVSFGTGKYLEMADNSTPFVQQSVYAVLDNKTTTADSSSPTAAISGRSRLQAGTVSGSTLTVAAFGWGRSMVDVDPNNIRSGWYFDFPTISERQISNFTVLAGTLYFGSVIPSVSSCDDGSGNLYAVNVFTGGGALQASASGILGQPFVVQVGATVFGQPDVTGLGTATATMQVLVQGSGGTVTPPPGGAIPPQKNLPLSPGRLSWREISNYQQMRNAP